jgi:hypothetical protein
MELKKYTIGDKIFIQKKLVLGQWKELRAILDEIKIPVELTPLSLVQSLGSNLFVLLAIVLTEDGKSLRGKDLAALADEIEYGITPDTAIEALADFFDLNPIPLILKSLADLSGIIKTKLTEIGLTNSASSSAAETSPGESGSSGM